jgi:hypothetical protein
MPGRATLKYFSKKTKIQIRQKHSNTGFVLNRTCSPPKSATIRNDHDYYHTTPFIKTHEIKPEKPKAQLQN